MKEPSLSRHRGSSIVKESKKLKLVLSFNGAFHLRSHSGKISYIGGETRLISMDRNDGFSKLRSKIYDLCPNVSSFSMRYQFSDPKPSASDSNERSLVLIDSEDDFQCMIDEYDKFMQYDKRVRLRVYVCGMTSVNCDGKKQNNECASSSASNSFAKGGVDFPVNGKASAVRWSNDAVEKSAMKHRLRAKQSILPSVTRTRSEISVRPGGIQNYIHPLIDMSPEADIPNVGKIAHESFGDRFQGGKNCGKLVKPPANRALPLNPRDGNLPVEAKRSTSYFSKQPIIAVSSIETNLNIGFGKQRDHRKPESFEDSQSEKLNSDESHVPHCDVGLEDRILMPCISDKPPSACLKGMENQGDLLNGIKCQAHETPYLGLRENFLDFEKYGEPSHFELQKEHSMDSRKNASETCYADRAGFVDNNKLPNGKAEINSSNLIIESRVLCEPAPSVDISSYNLSLSSCKGVEPPPKLPSYVSGVLLGKEQVSDQLGLKSRQNLDLKKSHVDEDEVEVIQDPKSTLCFNKKVEPKESKKFSNITRGVSSDLIAFYTHLSTRELQTIKNCDLECIKEIGSGTYGTVFYGKWKGSEVAIKKIKPSCLNDGLVGENQLVADFWKEAYILGQLHHPNIVAFYGVVKDGPATNLATVTEYMVNGSLQQVLRRKDRTIDRRKRLIIAMDAAFGMEYLHEKNIVHFDLKSHNLLVNMRDPKRPICKIGDMGLSKIKQSTLVSGSVRGTIPWMAPELLNSNNNLVTEKIDVYSFGIVMWELLTGEEPYSNLPSEEIIAGLIRGNLRPEIPSWCDPSWRSLMQKCWSSSHEARPSFSEIAKELRSMSEAMNIK